MALFPKIPPEMLAMLANPGAMFDQVRSFVTAAKALIAEVDAMQTIIEQMGGADDDGYYADLELALEASEKALWRKNAAFKAELAKLPDLPGGKVIDHGTR